MAYHWKEDITRPRLSPIATPPPPPWTATILTGYTCLFHCSESLLGRPMFTENKLSTITGQLAFLMVARVAGVKSKPRFHFTPMERKQLLENEAENWLSLHWNTRINTKLCSVGLRPPILASFTNIQGQLAKGAGAEDILGNITPYFQHNINSRRPPNLRV